jgi:hypothetical protein
MICSSLYRVPFITVLLLGLGRTNILDGPVFGGWVKSTGQLSWSSEQCKCVRIVAHQQNDYIVHHFDEITR